MQCIHTTFSDHFLQLLLHTIHHPFFLSESSGIVILKQINFETMNSLVCMDVTCPQFEFHPQESGRGGREPEMKKVQFYQNYKLSNEKKRIKHPPQKKKKNKTQKTTGPFF